MSGHFAAKRAAALVIFAVIATSLVTGAYLLLERFLQDRQSAMSHLRRPDRTSSLRRNSTGATTVPGGDASRRNPNPGGPPPVHNTGEAAIQRQLKTLEEINRINEMNRRLMDQQQRMQNHDR